MVNELTKVAGIGPKAATLLSIEGGLKSIEDLAKSDPKDLAKIKGIGLTSANKWIENAKSFLNQFNSNSSLNSSKPIKKKSPKKVPQSTRKQASSSVPKKVVKPLKTNLKQHKEPEFRDTAEPIPRFLYNRMSKKAQKILKLSFTTMKKENLKNLQNYIKILDPERVKFDPAYPDEKNAILAIDEKVKFMEVLIRKLREKKFEENLNTYVIIPLKRGQYSAITNKLGENFGPEEAAIRIFDNLNKKIKKTLLSNITEIGTIRDIQRIIEQSFPEKVALFYQRQRK
ncbi:MAG: helix-hairpin-helix domain-containing protein [Promethearchaeota archaeon]